MSAHADPKTDYDNAWSSALHSLQIVASQFF